MANEKELRIRYVGDARGVKKTLGDIDKMHASIGSRLQAVGTSMVSAGKRLSTSLSLPLIAFGGLAVSEFNEVQKVQGQTQAAIKSTGGAAGVTAEQISELSQRIGELSAIDGEQVQAAENVLLTFTNIRNEVGKGNDIFNQASLAVADLSARMGTDLNSAALQVGKALNDPIRGMTALSRVGVQFTEQQRDQITTLVESGKTMQAQKVILGELTKEFGGSAKAAGEAASPFQKISLAIRDLAEKAGPIVLPVLEKIADWLAKLADFFADLPPGVRTFVITLGGIAAAAGPVLVVLGKITSGIGTLIGGIGKLAGATKTATAAEGALAKGTGGLTSALGSGGLAGLISPAGVVVAGLGLVAAGFISARQEAAQMRKATEDLTKALVDGKTSMQDVAKALNDQDIPAWAKAKIQTQVLAEAQRRAGEQVTEVADRFLGSGRNAKIFRDQLVQLDGASVELKEKFANAARLTDEFGIQLSDATVYTVRAYMATGDYNAAIKVLNGLLGHALRGLKNLLPYETRHAEALADMGQKAAYAAAQQRGFNAAASAEPKGGRGGAGGGGAPVPRFAGGGVMRHTGLAIVGEHGPELVRLPAGAVVEPAPSGRALREQAIKVYVRQRLDVHLDRRRFGRAAELELITSGR